MQFHAPVDKNVRTSTKDESMEVADLLRFYFQRLLKGLTSTSIGKSDSFLSHFGHFPPCYAIISSGGLSSLPSYKIWLHPWQITRCGIQIPCIYMDEEYLLIAKKFKF